MSKPQSSFFYHLNNLVLDIIVSLIFRFLILSFLDFLAVLHQKSISLPWCLENVQVSAPHNMALCTNDLSINILVLFTVFFVNKTEFSMPITIPPSLFPLLHIIECSQTERNRSRANNDN